MGPGGLKQGAEGEGVGRLGPGEGVVASFLSPRGPNFGANIGMSQATRALREKRYPLLQRREYKFLLCLHHCVSFYSFHTLSFSGSAECQTQSRSPGNTADTDMTRKSSHEAVCLVTTRES